MQANLKVEREGVAIANSVVRPGQHFVIGRGSITTLRLKDARVSRKHALLELRGDGLLLTDLGSRNGTWVGSTKIPPRASVVVKTGGVIRVGHHALRVELVGFDAESQSRAGQNRMRDAPLLPADEFELLEEIGGGSHGRVWVAHEKVSGRKVAIKFLRREIQSGSEEHTRFLREGDLCSQVRHPHVVEYYGFRVINGRPFILMELLQGPSALDLLMREPLKLADGILIARDVGRALTAAAAANIVHRDVKPGNVFVLPGPLAKLGDFGIAKQLDDATNLTVAGLGIGSLPYSAPEQIVEARTVDARADIYSLGATLFHLLTGRTPFVAGPGEGMLKLFNRIQSAPAPLLGELRPEVPAEVESLIARMLAKSREERPQTAGEVVSALDEVLTRRFPTALAPPPDALFDSVDE